MPACLLCFLALKTRDGLRMKNKSKVAGDGKKAPSFEIQMKRGLDLNVSIYTKDGRATACGVRVRLRLRT
jgi:hypothetical protein